MPSFLAIKALASPESPPWQPSLGPHEIKTWGLMLKSGQDALRIILIRSDKALVAACAQPIKREFFLLRYLKSAVTLFLLKNQLPLYHDFQMRYYAS